MKIASVILRDEHYYAKSTLAYSYDSKEIPLKTGDIVKLPFSKKETEGVVIEKDAKLPVNLKKSQLRKILQKTPFALEYWQINLAKQIADYYFAPLKQCIKLFLPSDIWKNLEKLSLAKEKISDLSFDDNDFLALNAEQKFALENIKDRNLIFGVTGSGKTELFLHFFRQIFTADKSAQALLLVPEISLSPQMISYFKNIFGIRLLVLNSRLKTSEKREVWRTVKSGESVLVIGSRSALFLPWQNLKAVVVDEEHEWTYKQENSPRYHSHQVLFWLQGYFKNLKIIFASATPDLRSYYLAKKSELKLLELKSRVKNLSSPKIHVVDMRLEKMAKKHGFLSRLLTEKIRESLDQKKQVILFLNRRGYSSAIQCRSCGEIEMCDACNLPFTYHKRDNLFRLICHHCFRIKDMITNCSSCSSEDLISKGLGTQGLERIIREEFREARIFRADADSTSKKGSFTQLYEDMKNHQADILLGTQMISKGLNLENVNLVGIINADMLLHIPDYRSAERTFQQLVQVSGRSGRNSPGEVVLQTHLPENYSILNASKADYLSFYKEEIKNREALSYPPFSEIIKLSIKTKDIEEGLKVAELKRQEILKIQSKKNEVFMSPALKPKQNNYYHWNIIIKGKSPAMNLDKIDLQDWKIDRDPVNLS